MSKEGDDIFQRWEESDDPFELWEEIDPTVDPDLAGTIRGLGEAAQRERSKQEPPMEGDREAQINYQMGQDAITARLKLGTDSLIGHHVLFERMDRAIQEVANLGHLTREVEQVIIDLAVTGIDSVTRTSILGGKYMGEMIHGDVPPHPAWSSNIKESEALQRFKEQRRRQPPPPPSQGGK